MTTSETQALEEFGKAFIVEVFDASCKALKAKMTQGSSGREPDPLQLAYQSLDEESATLLRRYVAESIGGTLCAFLHCLDWKDVPVNYKTKSGDVVDVSAASDGLYGEPYNQEGWIEKYSDFPDGIFPGDLESDETATG